MNIKNDFLKSFLIFLFPSISNFIKISFLFLFFFWFFGSIMSLIIGWPWRFTCFTLGAFKGILKSADITIP